MSINVKCKCGAILQISEENIGQRAQCPQCNKVFVIPESLRVKFEAAKQSKGQPSPPAAEPSKAKAGRKPSSGKSKLKLIGVAASGLAVLAIAVVALMVFGIIGDDEPVAEPVDAPAEVTRREPREPEPPPPPERVEFGEFASPAKECARRLRGVYSALMEYRRAEGAYPPDLASLVPDYIAQNKVADFCCPISNGDGGLDDCYEYAGPEVASLTRFRMLVWDRDARHDENRRAALFSDGHTRLIDEEEFASLILEEHDGLWVTPGEVGLLNRLRPQLRVTNRRFAALEVRANGETLGMAPYGVAADFPVNEGSARISFALDGEETDALDLIMLGGMIHSITFPVHRELPVLNIRLMNYYATPPAARRALRRPEGPEYSPITRTENDERRLTGLRSSDETVTFISPEAVEPGAPIPRVDINNGLIYGEISRGDLRFTGLEGQPIKVDGIQRIAEGLEIRDDGTRITYLSTAIGAIIYDMEPNLALADIAMLKRAGDRSPWVAQQPDDMMMDHYHGMTPGEDERARRRPLIELPESFDIEPASFIGFVDYDAMAPHIRRLGRPVVNELISRYVGLDAPAAGRRRPSQPRPARRQPEISETKPVPPLWLASDMGASDMYETGMGRGGLLGPQTALDEMRDDPMMYDDMRPEPEEVERAEWDILAQTLGFLLTPNEMSVLLQQPQQRARRQTARRAGVYDPFVILALGRIGSPLAIYAITGWDDWRGGPPKKQPERPAQPDIDHPDDMPQDMHEGMMHDDPAMRDMHETAAMNIPAAISLAMIDSPLNEPGILRLDWFERLEDKARSVGLDYPGRAALARMLRDWNAEQLAMVMRAWPDMADWWPRHNFLKALAESGNRNLDNPGLLAEAYRFEPATAAELARKLLDEKNIVAPAQLLCRMGDIDAIESMLALAKSNNAGEAYTGVMALAAAHDRALLQPIKTAVERVLQAGNAEQRANVMIRWAELNISMEEDLAPLAELIRKQLDTDDEKVRNSAVNTLVLLAPSAGIEILAPALESTNNATRIAALEALAGFGDMTGIDAPAIVADAISGLREDVDEAEKQRLTELVLEALNAEDKDVLAAAIKAAGSLRIREAAEKLAGFMDELGGSEEAVDLLVVSARALGRIGDVSAVPQMRISLRDPSERVRKAVAEALGEMGSPAAVPDLNRALSDENSEVRGAAVVALGNIDDSRAYETLVQAAFPSGLQYSNVSWPALQALIKANQPAAYDALSNRIGENDVWVMWSAVNAAYNELAPDERDNCVRFLAGYLDSDHIWLRVLAAHGMAELERPELARALLVEKKPDPYGMVAPMAKIFGDAGNRDDMAALTRMFDNYRRFRGTPPGERDDVMMDDAHMHRQTPGMEQPEERQPEQPEVPHRIDPRLLIFEAAGRIGGPQAVAFLRREYDQRMPEEPMGYIVRALGESDAPGAVSQLVSIGRQVDSMEMRLKVIAALARVAHLDRGAAERLLNDAKGSDRADISAAAAEALDKMRRNLALGG